MNRSGILKGAPLDLIDRKSFLPTGNRAKTLCRDGLKSLVLLLFIACPALAQPDLLNDTGDGTYERLAEVLPDPQAKPLAGKVIVVDPGHGGKESGAVGPGGLLEKDVNLGVGIALADLLRQAGASVLLTRTFDTQVATGSTSLAADLFARIELANAAHADLFLSIHHNATLDPKNERNMTETYYRMVEPGPSGDAAAFIHSHLLRNLLLPQEKLLPGNYAVLRNAKVPAVLGEASYLSNAFTEKKLKSPEKQQLEAQAYFAGILDYFAHGTPRVLTLGKLNNHPATPTFFAKLDGGGSPIDPASIAFTLDGKRLPAYFETAGQRVLYRPADPLSNGLHHLALQFRNLGGNSSMRMEATMSISRPAQQLQLEYPLSAIPKAGPIPVILKVRDAYGEPVADGTPVTWNSDRGTFVSARTFTRSGRAIAYLKPQGKPRRINARVGKLASTLLLPKTQRPILLGLLKKPDGTALAGAQVLAPGRDGVKMTESNEDGYWWLDPAPTGLHSLSFAKPGYLPSSVPQRTGTFLSTSLRSATLASWSFPLVLNPEGGPEDRDPARRRASRANWQVASFLKDYLEAAGATAVLTRAADEGPSDIERVRLANQQHAMLFLSLSHASASLQTSHYPSSLKGQQIATALRLALLDDGNRAFEGETVPGSTYPLIQTTCPSVAVRMPLEGDLSTAMARREAYRLFLGLMPRHPHAATVSVQLLGPEGQPVTNGLVSLDGLWHGQTDENGRWSFGNLEPGDHQLGVEAGAGRRSYWIAGLDADERRVVVIDLARPQLPENLAARPR